MIRASLPYINAKIDMNIKLYTLLFFALAAFSLIGQERIDDSFAFQTDPAKKYSLYIPSSYDPGTANKLMVGFHPLNVNRWDARAWCDTLTTFAEENGLLLMCPDGGGDGRIDDPIDTAFTSVLIDSMRIWYNVDDANVFAMGFSWGGRTTYTYGLNHPNIFKGFLVIGAAVNGSSEFNSVVQNAKDKPFYLVHGTNDSQLTRYDLPKQALEMAGACVNTMLMQGVGHTIDFPNRNQILSDAFQWLASVECGEITSVLGLDQKELSIQPNVIRSGERLIFVGLEESIKSVVVFNLAGNKVLDSNTNGVSTSGLSPGSYFVLVKTKSEIKSGKFYIVD